MKEAMTLVEMVNLFKGEFPHGFEWMSGFHKSEFNYCVKQLSEEAWMNSGTAVKPEIEVSIEIEGEKEASKLRVDYFLMRGGKFAEGDAYISTDGESLIMNDEMEASAYSNPYDWDSHRFITSFAMRKHTGVQQAPDKLPIIFKCHGSHYQLPSLAASLNWGYKFDWKPNIEKLIEQQMKYDLAQGIKHPINCKYSITDVTKGRKK